jgi:hypothetical protein
MEGIERFGSLLQKRKKINTQYHSVKTLFVKYADGVSL